MKFFIVLFAFLFTTLSSCSKRDCGCVIPPVTESNWKITSIFGGFGGMEKELTDDQKNSTLTINSLGQYTCRNTITGQTTTGGVRLEQVDNNLTLCTFTPLLRIYPVSDFWMLERTNERMVLSERNPDGYKITFTRQ